MNMPGSYWLSPQERLELYTRPRTISAGEPIQEVAIPEDVTILPFERAGDADRDWLITRLGEAMATGHIDEAEFTARRNAALAARTKKELRHLADDLPEAEERRKRPTRAERRARLYKITAFKVAVRLAWVCAALCLAIVPAIAAGGMHHPPASGLDVSLAVVAGIVGLVNFIGALICLIELSG